VASGEALKSQRERPVPRSGIAPGDRHGRLKRPGGRRNGQRGVDPVGAGPGNAVRAVLDHDEFHVGDQAGQSLAGLAEGQDLVRVALDGMTGTSIFGRSARKSACQVAMQSWAAMADIVTATLKLVRYASSLTRLRPNWSILQKLPRKPLSKAGCPPPPPGGIPSNGCPAPRQDFPAPAAGSRR
jgi:hypothetical protein